MTRAVRCCAGNYFKAGPYLKDRVGLAVSVAGWFTVHAVPAGTIVPFWFFLALSKVGE